MDTAEKIQILKSRDGSTVTITRNGGDEVSALITKLVVDGEDTYITFMDVYEGVERTLGIYDMADIKPG